MRLIISRLQIESVADFYLFLFHLELLYVVFWPVFAKGSFPQLEPELPSRSAKSENNKL